MGINVQKPEPNKRGRQKQAQALMPKGPDWAVPAMIAMMVALVLLGIGAGLGQSWANNQKAVRQALTTNSFVRHASPLGWYLLVLREGGLRPKEVRSPWVANGMDYGNTRVPQTPRPAQLTLAWQYRPKKLDTVPPGVNVLSPTWFYVEEDGNGNVVVNDIGSLAEGKVNGWDPAQYIQTAHAGGAKVWASVVSFDPDLSRIIVNDATQQAAFIQKLAAAVQSLGLDGINFDFEKMDPADKEKFTALIAATKQAMPANSMISVDVTVPLATEDPKNWWQCYDRKGLGVAADYVCVMAYDNPDLEPVAAIGWVQDKMRMVLDQVPENKLLMGIPFFGVEYQFSIPEGVVLKDLPELTKSKTRKTITPSTVTQLLSDGTYGSGKSKVEVQYWLDNGTWQQQSAMTRYAFVDQGNLLHVFYCDDDKSVEAKGKLLTRNAIAGAAVWRMEFGTDAMWAALSRGMATR
jgi:spore germination protein YaaH